MHFLLMGRGLELPDHPLRARANALGLRDRITFAGERPHPQNWMGAMDVVVSSSFAEGFPNVIAEAMACGIPCVATDVGDSRNIVGDAGRIVPSRDAEALGAAMVALVSLPAGERADLAVAARGRVIEKFSLDPMAAAYAAIYEPRAPEGLISMRD